MTTNDLPVIVVGGGPVGLITALGLTHYGVNTVVFEEDDDLSSDTKAGTVLTRTLEVLHRYGALEPVLRGALSVEEIGELDRATNELTRSIRTSVLAGETRFPFIVNIPQHHLEPVLRQTLEERAAGAVRMGHRVTGFRQQADHVDVDVEMPDGPRTVAASYVLACDGGHSTVRERLGIAVTGKTLDERYMLIDLAVDLDVENPRDYPYLAYFGDPTEWMILIRFPHCWRFLYPLPPGAAEPTVDALAQRARRFIGDADHLEVIGTSVYTVHHRVAERWWDHRIFLMGDAAHLITPVWALGLNTGVLDASNLPWRLAWVLRGWADDRLLAGYEREQAPVAIRGFGALAEAARAELNRRGGDTSAVMSGGNWGNAMTRTLLGVRLDVHGTGDWSMVQRGDRPGPVRTGDRVPDVQLFAAGHQTYLHDLIADSFVALYFTDTRRAPRIPADESPALRRFAVSRWDTPFGTGLRDRTLFDPGDLVRERLGVALDTLVLVRPDAHIAALVPLPPDSTVDVAAEHYKRITGVWPPRATALQPVGTAR